MSKINERNNTWNHIKILVLLFCEKKFQT